MSHQSFFKQHQKRIESHERLNLSSYTRPNSKYNFGYEMIMLSSNYFHGNWQTHFRRRLTRKEKFFQGTCENGQVQNIEMMNTQRHFNYGNISNLRSTVIEILYANPANKLLVILPWMDCRK